MSDTAVITQEQLRQFFERANQAEQLANALSQQIETIKASAGINDDKLNLFCENAFWWMIQWTYKYYYYK